MTSMEDLDTEDLESIIGAIKLCNKEAIRIFNEVIHSASLATEASSTSEESSSVLNLGWVDTHLHRVENKLEKVDIEILKWKNLKEKLHVATIEQVDVTRLYLEEQLRTQTLYQSLNIVILSQQSQESQIQDLKLKCKVLQREQKKLQNQCADSDSDLKRLKEKCQGLMRSKEKRLKDSSETPEDSMITKKPRNIAERNSNEKVTYIGSDAVSASRKIQNSTESLHDSQVRKKVIVSSSGSGSGSGIPHHDLITALNGNGDASLTFMCSNSDSNSGDGDIEYLSDNETGHLLLRTDSDENDIEGDGSNKNTDQTGSQSKPHIQSHNKIRPDSTEHKKIIQATVVKKENTEQAKKIQADLRINSLIGREIRKPFRGYSGIFKGTVKQYKEPYFTICYEDGDKEEMNETEILRWIVVAKKK